MVSSHNENASSAIVAPHSTRRFTALVTGASSGLGLEFARLLAERGYDLILTARRRERLIQLREELLTQHPASDIQIVVADLDGTNGEQSLIAAVQASNKHVDLLVNNAGFGCYGQFLEQEPESLQSMINVNVTSATLLLRHFAAVMAARSGGEILQVSSFAGLQPIPRYSVYSAAKAYGIALVQSLRHEFRKNRVKLSVVAPGFMKTEFHDVAQHQRSRWMEFLNQEPRDVAEAGLRGVARNKMLITPGFLYTLNRWLLRLIPRGVAASISARMVKSRSLATDSTFKNSADQNNSRAA